MPGPESTRGHHDGFLEVEAARRRAWLYVGALAGVLVATAAGLAALTLTLALASGARPISIARAASVPKPADPSPTAAVVVPEQPATDPPRSAPAPTPAPVPTPIASKPAPPPSSATKARHSMLGSTAPASRPLASASEADAAPRRVAPSAENSSATTNTNPVDRGRELFARRWQPNDPRSRGGDGLGPVYNADSCLACHFQGGPGGAGPAEANVTIVTRPSKNAAVRPPTFARSTSEFGGRTIHRPVSGAEEWASVLPALAKAPGVVVHRHGVDPAYASLRAAVLELAYDPTWKDVGKFVLAERMRQPPPRHCEYVAPTRGLDRYLGLPAARLAQRSPPPLFGTGLIDAIPDRVLLEEEARQRSDPRTAGRAHRLKDGRIGRFGWKAETASLGDFVRLASANELGLEVPGLHQAAPAFGPASGDASASAPPGLDLDQSDCEALTAYVRQLPAPTLRSSPGSPDRDDIAAGRRAFATIGCADCHTPSLGGVDGIYSDLLLHDLGQPLASLASEYSGSAPSEGSSDPSAPGDGVWRTAPLWGLAASAPYLHDGRARTLIEAIAAHRAQGERASKNYFLQPEARRNQILAFLKALAPPTPPLAPAAPPSLAADPSLGRWRNEIEAASLMTLKNSVDFIHLGVSSKLKVAANLEKNGKPEAALQTYRKLIEEHPGSDAARSAQKRIAELERKSGPRRSVASHR